MSKTKAEEYYEMYEEFEALDYRLNPDMLLHDGKRYPLVKDRPEKYLIDISVHSDLSTVYILSSYVSETHQLAYIHAFTVEEQDEQDNDKCYSSSG